MVCINIPSDALLSFSVQIKTELGFDFGGLSSVPDFSKQVEKMTEAQVEQLAGTFTVIFLDPDYSNTLHV